MNYFYLLAVVFALLCSACNHPTNSEPATTEPTTTTVAEPVSDRVGPPAQEDPYAAERQKIKQEVERINSNLENYTKKQYDQEEYQLYQYVDKDGIMVKAEAISKSKQWSFYAQPINQTDRQIIYALYTEKSATPTSQQYFSIGSMVQGPGNFALVVDAGGNFLKGQRLMAAEQAYEEAMLTFTVPR